MNSFDLKLDFTKVTELVERIRPWPWRLIVWILTISFITASLVSTIIGYLIMGQTSLQKSISLFDTKEVSFHWESGPSISKVQLDKILERNIFNSEGTMGVDSPVEGGNNRPPKTSLPVKIVGIIYGGNPLTGLAVVENTEKKSVNSFLVGDPLTPDGSATIKEVHLDEVLILNHGRLEFAPLEEPEIRRSSRKGKKQTSKIDTPLSLGGNGFTTEPPPENYKEDGFERKGTSIEMTQEYKGRLLTTDFASVLQDAKANPNLVDGVVKGWRMDRIRKGSIYEKAGVQNNDVIEEVNGVMLSDAAQAVKALQQLKSEDSFELRLIRAGKPVNITFKVR
jgi:type II secretion system protein C